MDFFQANKLKMSTIFENWTIEKRERSAYETFPLPEWSNELGFWSNSVALLQEVQTVSKKSLLMEG